MTELRHMAVLHLEIIECSHLPNGCTTNYTSCDYVKVHMFNAHAGSFRVRSTNFC